MRELDLIMHPRLRAQPSALFLLGVFALSAAVYLPTLSYPFTNWDDVVLVTKNPLLREVSLASLRRIFTSFYAHDYWPVNLVSLSIDRLLWGYQAMGYHLTNLVLHALNATVLYALLARLAGPGVAPLIGALWFGLHPMHVESVTWVAERKNVLSQLFFLAAFMSYLASLGRPPARSFAGAGLRRRWYAASLGFFVLAILTKTSTVVLPAMLVAYHLCARRPGLRRSLPFFAVAMLGSAITLFSKAEFVQDYPAGSFAAALMTLPTLLLAYAAKLLLPTQLNALYDFAPVRELGMPKFWLALLGLCGMALVLRALWRWERLAAFGLAWFVLGLAPVLNLVPFPILFAERYAYLPSVGLVICGVVVATRLGRSFGGSQAGNPERAGQRTGPGLRRPALLTSVAGLAMLSLLTMSRSRVWSDSVLLWNDVIRKSPRLSLPHHNLGAAYRKRGFQSRAVAEYLTTLHLDPDHPESLMNLGNVYLVRGYLDRAVVQYNIERSRFPRSALALSNLGIAFSRLGMPGKAAPVFERAVRLAPGDSELYVQLASTYLRLDRYVKAIARSKEGLALHRGEASLFDLLGSIYEQLNDQQRSAAMYLRAVQLDASLAARYINLSHAHEALGNRDRALAAAQEALALAPDLGTANANLGALLNEVGRYQQAERFLRIGLRHQPQSAKTRVALSRALGEAGSIAKAMLEVKRGLTRTPRLERGWRQLGNLYTSLRRTSQAASAYRAVVRLPAADKSDWNRLGHAWFEDGKLDRAASAYLQSLIQVTQYPMAASTPIAWNNLGNIAASRGRTAPARRALLHALAVKPEYEQAHINLGSLLSRQGRFDAALAHFSMALMLNPGRLESTFNIGSMLEARGRVEQALRWYTFFRNNWQGADGLSRIADRKIARLRAQLKRR